MESALVDIIFLKFSQTFGIVKPEVRILRLIAAVLSVIVGGGEGGGNA